MDELDCGERRPSWPRPDVAYWHILEVPPAASKGRLRVPKRTLESPPHGAFMSIQERRRVLLSQIEGTEERHAKDKPAN
jgi:hypothetical protein